MKPIANQKLGIKSITIKTPDKVGTIELLEIKGFTRKGKTDFFNLDQLVRLEADPNNTWFTVKNQSGTQIVGCKIDEKKVGDNISFVGTTSKVQWTVVCYPLNEGLPEVAPKNVVITVEGATAKAAPPAKSVQRARVPPEGATPPTPQPPVKLVEGGQAAGPPVAPGTIVAITKSMVEPDADDFETLNGCETVVEKGLRAFVALGKAFKTIRDREFFKGTYETFEAYCQVRWGRTLREVNKIIAATEVYELLESQKVTQLPQSDKLLQALAKLPREAVVGTWTKAVDRADGGTITTEMIVTVGPGKVATNKNDKAAAFFRLLGRLDDALALCSPTARKAVKTALAEKPEAEVQELVGEFLEMCSKLLGLATWLQQHARGAKPPKVQPTSRSTKPARRASLKVVKTS